MRIRIQVPKIMRIRIHNSVSAKSVLCCSIPPTSHFAVPLIFCRPSFNILNNVPTFGRPAFLKYKFLNFGKKNASFKDGNYPCCSLVPNWDDGFWAQLHFDWCSLRNLTELLNFCSCRSCELVSYISWWAAPVLEGAVGCLRPQGPFFRLHRYFVNSFVSRKSQEYVTMMRGRIPYRMVPYRVFG